jgi:diketogulonate reductase-like aldo/keto reductase
MQYAAVCTFIVYMFIGSGGAVAALPASYPTIPMRGVAGNVPMPLIGLGTWQYNSSEAEAAIATAFRIGYRHVDTALGYANQEGVGRALKTLALPRDDYFVTGKVPGGLNASATTAALELSLQQLQLDHVDLMLLHFPNGGREGRQAQWTALEAWAKKGGAKAIGVSHYCRRHLDNVLAVATLPVANNQVQYHVGMGRETTSELHDMQYMRSKGVVYAAYSSLCGPCPDGGHAALISGPLVTSIGAKHGKSGAQVSLRWVVQQGIPVIPKATHAQYLAEDFDLFDWTLSDDEMVQLTAATKPPQTGTPPQAPDDDQDCLVP